MKFQKMIKGMFTPACMRRSRFSVSTSRVKSRFVGGFAGIQSRASDRRAVPIAVMTCLGFMVCNSVFGQGTALLDSRTTTTAAPFLLISPDARGAGMGDNGVATSADVNAMHWNPAKYAFETSDNGIGVSFTPWLKRLTNDVNLGYVSAFKKLDGQQTLAASFKYFSYGNINYVDAEGVQYGSSKPADFSVDLAYIRRLNDEFSMALAGRFIHSDIGQSSTSGVSLKPASAESVDIAIFYNKETQIGSLPSTVSWGIDISNIGTKLNYGGETNQFLPANLRIGAGSAFHFDEFNTLAVNLDINKLLVPTPPVYDNNHNVIQGKDPNVSVSQGLVQSFYDAPGGFHEELQELSYSAGMEYSYARQFFLRTGYFYENPVKGNRQYFTLGAGFRFKALNLDLAYLLADRQSPLANTLRISLNFNFGEKFGGGSGEN